MRSYLASGQLVEILPDYRPAPMPTGYANRRQLPQRVQVFMRWMTASVAVPLAGNGGVVSHRW
jgi:DNA-binding transcriptional LysR family regulator